ncbi:hypothetical protein JHFBIEKO_3941 [Methylobacterium mesophilicum]|nr:hypothetical protein JHFBIEKO_3941 [Methylobacterium mesophilicum]
MRRAGWLAGLPALALIWAGATLFATPQIADALEAAGAQVASGTATATGEPWLRLEARGRDLAAEGEAPDVGERETVLARLAALDGPRRIVSEVGLVETAAPFLWAAIRTGSARVALEGSRPAEIGRRALEARITGALAPGTYLDDTARAARGAPPDFAGAAAFLAARLSGLAKGGRAALSDTVLSLSGEALDVPAYEALRTALANPPAGFSVGRIEIVPPAVAQFRFSVAKSARGIVLDGFAPSAADRAAALRAAAEAVPGGSVQDRLLTARGLDPAIDPKTLIGFAFRLAELIQSGTVAFAEDSISVTGDAIDAQAIPDAAALMREARPAGVKPGPVTLAARPLSPYRVAIRRTPEAVTLTGHLPDDATRERVLAALRPRLFREPVIDRTRLADGAPPDLGAALAAAAPLVANLAAGEVAVSDRALTLTGESLYREAASRTPERLAEALPPGWTGQAAVTARQPAETRDPAACRAEAGATIAGASLRFPAGGATLGPTFYPVLDALAVLAKACPALRIAVSAPADPAKAKPAQGAGAGEGAGEGAAPTETPPTPMAAQPAATGAVKDAPKEPAKPAPKAQAETHAAPKNPEAAKKTDGKKTDAKSSDAKSSDGKTSDGKSAASKPASSQKTAKQPPKEATDDPPLDLPRLRAQAVIEYLLQAGVRPDQVGAGPDAPAGPVILALLP